MTNSRKYIRYIIVFLQAAICCHKSFSQDKVRITHASGDSLVACIKVNVTSRGVVDRNLNGCPETGPYNIGYNLSTQTSANGSYTFTFTPAVDSLTLNISGISYLDWGKELVRLYVNGQHYPISAGSKLNCDVPAVLTSDGDLTGCYPCGASAWGEISIKGSITSLTILDSCDWGYGNGVKASVDIYGKQRPSTAFSLGKDTALCMGETLLLNATMSNATYQWQDGSTGATFIVTKEGTYWVTVTDSCGSIKDTINIKYKNCDYSGNYNCNIQLPNAFTPNNDGKNDRFPQVFNCDFSNYELKIFNRWGELIFQSTSPTKSWHGIYMGALQPTGVYIYLLNYRLSSGDKKTKSGTITLIR